MRTAIFVYQTSTINISTSESDLQLCSMDAGTTSLSEGENERLLEPGIYKIVSCHDVNITCDSSAFEIFVTADNKENIPKLPPRRISETFAPLDVFALQAFFAIDDAKVLASP